MIGRRHLWQSAGAGLLALLAAPAVACTSTNHVVAPGETVFAIAESHYGDLEDWSLIFYSNPGKLANPLEIPAGTELVIPCPVEGRAFVADATPLQRATAELTLVTGSNYPPFTDRTWPGQGMITELINAAMEETPDPVTFSISWEDDWSTHLGALDQKEFDMGFPWLSPDCGSSPDQARCADFHFSDPILELLQLLFVRDGSEMVFETESDLYGKALCRPAGYLTFDLEGDERALLADGRIRLEQPATPAACFDLLMQGRVDAVALNEFTGWTTISDMGLQAAVTPLAKPLSVEGLHVVISKRHWRGTTHLYRVNAGLAKLKETDRYDQIVSRHLGVFWDRVN